MIYVSSGTLQFYCRCCFGSMFDHVRSLLVNNAIATSAASNIFLTFSYDNNAWVSQLFYKKIYYRVLHKVIISL